MIIFADPDDPGDPSPSEANLFIELSNGTHRMGTVEVDSLGRIAYELRFSLADGDTGHPPAGLGGSGIFVNRETGETNAAIAIPDYIAPTIRVYPPWPD